MKQHLVPITIAAILAVAASLPAAAEGRHKDRGENNGNGEARREMRVDERHEMRNDFRRTERHSGWGRDRDIRHFEVRHLPVWRTGTWHHSLHEGRLGWWWVVAGTWYFYPLPVYPYPDPYVPPFVVVQPSTPPAPETPSPPPQAQYWYYCEASKSYYPYVSSCPAGWKEVPATPTDAPAK